MLTKAILTGGVLSVLAGSIVYFGTEGADALEGNAVDSVRVEETELAGAAVVADPEVEATDVTEAATADVQDPPKETSKPKTKWLDQYLKKSKPTADSDPIVIETKIEEVEVETTAEPDAMPEKKKRFHVEKHMKKEGSHGESHDESSHNATPHNEAKGSYIVSEGGRIETLDVKGLDLENLDIEDEADVEALIEELGLELDSEKDVDVRIVKRSGGKSSLMEWRAEGQSTVDYHMVLTEAKKLLVTDMRNQAFLEIIDHAIDQDDVMKAADIVDELSTPELRDTARARIGVGLARRGDAEAAFAVLEELEIDELSAPIRLEIITALMATKQERKSFASQ